jgi:methylated-DNA-protein-cysteine methyltransferase related protein
VTRTGPGSDFERDVLKVIRGLRRGDVVTYGEIALEAGYPKLSRGVGAVLSRNDDPKLPWWRVVNATGRLVPDHEIEQARRLVAEGIHVDLEAGRVPRFRS